MLNPSQISDMKTKDPDSFNLWRSVTDAINTFGLQMGVDPKPANQVDVRTAIPPPRAPKSLQVVSIAGAVLVLLEAGEGNLPTAFYFVESSTTRTFQQVTRYTLGHGLHLAVPLLAGVTFWRAFCKYQMSLQSPFVVASSLSGGSGTSGGGTSTVGVASIEDARHRPPGMRFGDDFEEPRSVVIPGKRGIDGVIGRDGRLGPPPEETEPPIIIPGRRGATGSGGGSGVGEKIFLATSFV